MGRLAHLNVVARVTGATDRWASESQANDDPQTDDTILTITLSELRPLPCLCSVPRVLFLESRDLILSAYED